MYTSCFVLFGHFFYHAYLARNEGQGIKEKVLQEGVTIISPGTHDMKASNADLHDPNVVKGINDNSSEM